MGKGVFAQAGFACGVLALFMASGIDAHAAQAGHVTVSKRVCQNLVAHQTSPDVAYQPGVDVHGRPVVPADLNSTGRIEVPREITIPITIDLFERMGREAPRGVDLSTTIGVVRYSGGRFTFNGQPLGDEGQQHLAVACRQAGY